MTTYIKVQIDCDGEYCGSCHYKRGMGFSPYKMCWIHEAPLYTPTDYIEPSKTMRCQACLNATIKETVDGIIRAK